MSTVMKNQIAGGRPTIFSRRSGFEHRGCDEGNTIMDWKINYKYIGETLVSTVLRLRRYILFISPGCTWGKGN